MAARVAWAVDGLLTHGQRVCVALVVGGTAWVSWVFFGVVLEEIRRTESARVFLLHLLWSTWLLANVALNYARSVLTRPGSTADVPQQVRAAPPAPRPWQPGPRRAPGKPPPPTPPHTSASCRSCTSASSSAGSGAASATCPSRRWRITAASAGAASCAWTTTAPSLPT
jgi:hypothetical protein